MPLQDMPDLTQLAANAGFSGPDLATAVAVAMAESGGDPHAYNPEGSYGLWQIYLPAHSEFAGLDPFDPPTNAYMAFDVYSKARGFSPWTMYKNRKYLAFLPPGLPPAASPVPLTLDAATGFPIADSPTSFRTAISADAPIFAEASILPQGLSFGKVFLWGAIGLFGLWLFEEAL